MLTVTIYAVRETVCPVQPCLAVRLASQSLTAGSRTDSSSYSPADSSACGRTAGISTSGVLTAAEDDATTGVDDGPGVADLVARTLVTDEVGGRERSPAVLTRRRFLFGGARLAGMRIGRSGREERDGGERKGLT
jgi:hypothetical protein